MEITVNGVVYVPKAEATELSGRVLVRCRNAGVHVGTRDRTQDTEKELCLVRANRIWRWRGAHDLSYVVMEGVDRSEYTRISVEVPQISLVWSDVCEIIPVVDGVDLSEVQND